MRASIALMTLLLPRLLAEEDCRNEEQSNTGPCRQQAATTKEGSFATPPQKYPSSAEEGGSASSVTMEAMTSVGSQKVLEDESLTSLPSLSRAQSDGSETDSIGGLPESNLLPVTLPLQLAQNVVIPFRPISESPALPMDSVFLDDPQTSFMFHHNDDEDENDFQCCLAPDPIGDGYSVAQPAQRNASKHTKDGGSIAENAKQNELAETKEEGAVLDEDAKNSTIANTTDGHDNLNTTQEQDRDISTELESSDVAEEEAEEAKTDLMRVDYASKSAGAQVIEKSPGWSGTSDLLNSDNDRYAIVPTSPEDGKTKFIVIALSEEILVKSVVLTNYERYSSHVKEFQILGSQTMANWVDLGRYTASPPSGSSTREAFDITPNSPAGENISTDGSGGAQYWARYLKFRFLSHYGDEHYLTITQILVHGTTMQQGFQEHWEEQEEEKQLLEGTEAQRQEQDVIKETGGSEDSEQDPTSTTKENVQDIVDQDSSLETAESEQSGDGNASDRTTASEQTGRVIPSDGSEGSEGAVEKPNGLGQSPVVLNEEGYVADSFPDSWKRIAEQRVECPAAKQTCSVFNSSSLARQSKAIRSSVDRWVIRAEVLDQAQVNGSASVAVRFAEDVTGANPTALGRLGKKNDENSKPSRTLLEKLLLRISNDIHRSALTPAWKERAVSDRETNSESTTREEEVGESSSKAEKDNTKDQGEANDVNSEVSAASVESISVQSESSSTDAPASNNILLEDVQTMELLLATVPSASCLNELNVAYQQSRATQNRASGSGSTSSGQSGNGMEPIFKKLTDEIKSLQTSLSAQEKFSKGLTTCFQKVLLDLLVLQASERAEHLERLQVLEQRMLRGDWVYTMLGTGRAYLSEFAVDHLSSLESVLTLVYLHIDSQAWFEPIRAWFVKHHSTLTSAHSSWMLGFPFSLLCLVLLRRYRLRRSQPVKVKPTHQT